MSLKPELLRYWIFCWVEVGGANLRMSLTNPISLEYSVIIVCIVILVIKAISLSKGGNVIQTLKIMAIISTMGFVASLSLAVQYNASGRWFSGLGVLIVIYSLMIPFALKLNYILYLIVFTKVLKDFKFKLGNYLFYTIALYATTIGLLLTDETILFIVISILALISIFLGLPIAIISMLITGLKATKSNVEKRWLIIAFLLPVIGSLYVIFVWKESKK